MEIWEAIVLGVLQGLTEFLPVSSSGHLELANHLFGIHEPNNMAFTMALHGGTVLSTLVVFWKDIVKIFQGVFKFTLNDGSIMAINIFISLIPICFVGLFFMDYIEQFYTGNLLIVGIMLVVTAVLLTVSGRIASRDLPITPMRALIIGISQAIAVIPGLSRSGTTIATGLMLGVKREEVARFSFLMVLIPIIGMNVLELLKSGNAAGSIISMNVALGFFSAFVTGLFACRLMIRLVSGGRLIWFALYCLLVGVGSILIAVL